MKLKHILWYLGVIAAVALLAVGIFTRSWLFSLTGCGLTMILKVTNHNVPLPRIYRDMGIDNEVFEGRTKQKNEEDNQSPE